MCIVKALTELDFKIVAEHGLARIEIRPKERKASKVLFYSPNCQHCVKHLSELGTDETIYAVNVANSPHLSTHFNINIVPYYVDFGEPQK